MDTPASILEDTRGLIDDPAAKAAFAEDPDGFLASRGLDGFSGQELAEALSHVADALPPHQAAQLPDGEGLAALGEAPDGPTALFGEIAAVEPAPSEAADLDFGAGAGAEGEDVDPFATVGDEDPAGEVDALFEASLEESSLEDDVDTHVDDHLDGDLAEHLHGDVGGHEAADGFDLPS